MARIRSIKPDAFTSETLSNVSVLARWTFAGLWTYCDDHGRGRYDVRLIKAALFPLDDTTTLQHVTHAIEELALCEEAICLYEQDGRKYLHIPRWKDHQKVSHASDSKIPGCLLHSPDPLQSPPEDLGKPPESFRPEQGTGNREQGGEARKRARRLPDDWRPSDKHREQATQLGLDVDAQADEFRDHFKANGKTGIDWEASFRNWLRRTAKWSEERTLRTVSAAPAQRRHVPLEVPSHIDPDDAEAYAAWLRSEAK